MMCARLLRTEDADGGRRARRRQVPRRGFYAWLDRGYTWTLRLAMRHRLAWCVLVSVVTLASTVPIYRQVKQEYIPSDVDEAEFEVLVFGPEGMSLAAMDEAMQALGRGGRERAGCAAHAGLGRRQLPGPRQPGLRATCAPCPTPSARSSLHRFWDGPASAASRWPRSAATTPSAT